MFSPPLLDPPSTSTLAKHVFNAEDNAELVTVNNGEALSSLVEDQNDFFDDHIDEKGLLQIFSQTERTTKHRLPFS
jgi:hypothetical protein